MYLKHKYFDPIDQYMLPGIVHVPVGVAAGPPLPARYYSPAPARGQPRPPAG